MKEGNKRATKVFESEQDALTLSALLEKSWVEMRIPKDERFIQIQYGTFHEIDFSLPFDQAKEQIESCYEKIECISGLDLDGYIERIPLWIDFCKNVLIPLHHSIPFMLIPSSLQ